MNPTVYAVLFAVLTAVPAQANTASLLAMLMADRQPGTETSFNIGYQLLPLEYNHRGIHVEYSDNLVDTSYTTWCREKYGLDNLTLFADVNRKIAGDVTFGGNVGLSFTPVAKRITETVPAAPEFDSAAHTEDYRFNNYYPGHERTENILEFRTFGTSVNLYLGYRTDGFAINAGAGFKTTLLTLLHTQKDIVMERKQLSAWNYAEVGDEWETEFDDVDAFNDFTFFLSVRKGLWYVKGATVSLYIDGTYIMEERGTTMDNHYLGIPMIGGTMISAALGIGPRDSTERDPATESE